MALDPESFFYKSSQFDIFKVISNFSIMHHRYLAGLLGNNDNIAVGQFRKTECCPVSGAETLGNIGILRERQQAARFGEFPAFYDHCTIMNGRVGQKNRVEQFTGDFRIYFGPDMDYMIDGDLPDQHDQRSDLLLSHIQESFEQLFDRFDIALKLGSNR